MIAQSRPRLFPRSLRPPIIDQLCSRQICSGNAPGAARNDTGIQNKDRNKAPSAVPPHVTAARSCRHPQGSLGPGYTPCTFCAGALCALSDMCQRELYAAFGATTMGSTGYSRIMLKLNESMHACKAKRPSSASPLRTPTTVSCYGRIQATHMHVLTSECHCPDRDTTDDTQYGQSAVLGMQRALGVWL
jgi:hypothetical protein